MKKLKKAAPITAADYSIHHRLCKFDIVLNPISQSSLVCLQLDKEITAFFPDFLTKTSKDSKRERDRENKNKKKDFDKTSGGGHRPNQGGRNQMSRIPKALQKPAPQQKQEEKKPEIKEITIPEKLTIRELAEAMKMQPSAIVKKLFLQGKVVTINQEVDYDTAEEIALEFNCICDHEVKVDVIAELLKEDEESEDDMVARPPVVCVMGHVDQIGRAHV